MDLVGRLNLRKSTVSRLVTGLVDRGWVMRSVAPDDGRGVLLDLTPSGSDAASRLARARRERLRALLAAVPAARRRDVIEVFRLMEEAARVIDTEYALAR
jgi:DNA-binding MarR family transcriptional regulator